MQQPEPQKDTDTAFRKFVLRVFGLLNLSSVKSNNAALVEASSDARTNADKEIARQINETRHKSYLELRGKTEGVGASARLEMDKSILTLSSAGLALTLGMIEHFHFLLWQVEIIIGLFIGAIVMTLLSMRITERSSEKFIDVIDKAYDASIAEDVGELPIDKIISDSGFETKFLLTNSIVLECLNNLAFILFLAAILTLVYFATMQTRLAQMGDSNKMASEKKDQTQTSKNTEEKGQKMPSVPKPPPKPTPATTPKTQTTKQGSEMSNENKQNDGKESMNEGNKMPKPAKTNPNANSNSATKAGQSQSTGTKTDSSKKSN
ncbi:hypothetical protein KBF38_23780 [bacterium]|nr:hypothetical protein [bacterium]